MWAGVDPPKNNLIYFLVKFCPSDVLCVYVLCAFHWQSVGSVHSSSTTHTNFTIHTCTLTQTNTSIPAKCSSTESNHTQCEAIWWALLTWRSLEVVWNERRGKYFKIKQWRHQQDITYEARRDVTTLRPAGSSSGKLTLYVLKCCTGKLKYIYIKIIYFCFIWYYLMVTVQRESKGRREKGMTCRTTGRCGKDSAERYALYQVSYRHLEHWCSVCGCCLLFSLRLGQTHFPGHIWGQYEINSCNAESTQRWFCRS